MPDHPPPLSDTSRDARRVMFAVYRQMPPWRKVQLVDDAVRSARCLALSGLRARHPEASAEELHRRLLGLLLGEETAQRILGPIRQ